MNELQSWKGGGQGRVGNSLDYEQDDDLLGSSMGDLDRSGRQLSQARDGQEYSLRYSLDRQKERYSR